MEKLTCDKIRFDNPHFGSEINLVKEERNVITVCSGEFVAVYKWIKGKWLINGSS